MQSMWHCSVKSSSPATWRRWGLCVRNPGKPKKVLTFKAVRGVQTLYMTGRMQINGNHVMANGRALRLLGVRPMAHTDSQAAEAQSPADNSSEKATLTGTLVHLW